MTERLTRPIRLFRFALREGDLLLAAALAEHLHREREARRQMSRGLAESGIAGAGSGSSVLALRTLGRIARLLGLGGVAS
jgi:hypothetical protein